MGNNGFLFVSVFGFPLHLAPRTWCGRSLLDTINNSRPEKCSERSLRTQDEKGKDLTKEKQKKEALLSFKVQRVYSENPG